MTVWRDTWEGDPQVIVVSPSQPTPDGFLPEAAVILNGPQQEPVVTVTTRAGQALHVTLPPDLLDGERRNVETNTVLKLHPQRPA